MAGGDDLQSKASELLKKVVTAGVGAAFLTEEGVKGLLNEMKLPKELLAGFIESAGRTKKEFLNQLSNDLVAKLSEKIDPKDLIEEVADRFDIDLQIRVSLTPKKKKSKSSEA